MFVRGLALGIIIAAGVLIFAFGERSAEAPRTMALDTDTIESTNGAVSTAIAQIREPGLRADLEKFYAENQNLPLWATDREGRRRVESLEDVAHALASQGIDAVSLHNAHAALKNARNADERIRADLAMSTALLGAARGQRFGFVSGSELKWNLIADEAEIASFLGEAAANSDIPAFFASLRPPTPQFQALTDALARYREIAAAGGWPRIPDDREINFEDDTRLELLRKRLNAEGYLSASAGIDGIALQDAVKTFQARNGLEPDGRAGRGTLAALNVSVEDRIGQIIANLERWRHMRHEAPERYVVANVADQSVAVIHGGREEFRLRTIVGTPRHATPMLEAELTAVTLNPPWEIPTSIVTNEILPKLDDEPYYLKDNSMEIVAGSWDQPKSLRVRQRPGAENSLGLMKFQMQNRWNIYLHDTPARALFAKTDRYFSHGCVRVEHPHELALALLPDDIAIEDIEALIAAGGTHTLKLETPVPVFVLYWTAFVGDDGHLQFRRDTYGRDAVTVAALTRANLLHEKSGVVRPAN